MIGRAEELGDEIHIYCERGSLLARVGSGDGLVGWNDSGVIVRRSDFLLTYDPTGAVSAIDHLREQP